MSNIRIAIGTDHRGYSLKQLLMQERPEIEWLDQGAHNEQRSDYPIYAAAVCRAIQEKRAHHGVLLCGSGVGMTIAANRFASIYAGLIWNEAVAIEAKREDNINVLVIPADYVSDLQALSILDAWIKTPFDDDEERYHRRLRMIETLTH